MRVPIGLTGRTALTAIFAIFIVILPNKAVADATVFAGMNTMTPHSWARGFSAGLTLLNLGFEVEYANAGEDKSQRTPGLQTGMVNVLVQTPMTSNGFQFYATTGGGLYRERLADLQETHVGLNAGGGLKIRLTGQIRARIDYRVFSLRGAPIHSRPHRVYAGLNLAF